MKNITLSVDERVLAAVRRYASERETTVNGLVRDYLTRLANQEDRAAQARSRLVELSATSEGSLGAWKWDREELYDRGMLSRHEHSGVRGFREGSGGGEEESGK
ncbi:MAG: DUF6364 family protein [Rhodomicrobiaceae bacterium]